MKKMLHDQKGAAAVEFAIILPLLVVFVFGIIEFGLVLYDKAVVTNASREGARAGILYHEPRITVAEIQTVVANYSNGMLVSFGGPTNATATVPSGECVNHGDLLLVNVTYQYDFLMIPDFLAAFFGGNIPDPIDVSTSTTMRCE